MENPFKRSPDIEYSPEEAEKRHKEMTEKYEKESREKGSVDYIGKSGVIRETLKPDESIEDAIARAKERDEKAATNKK